MVTKKESLGALITGGSVLIVTPLAMKIVPAFYDIPGIAISVGALLSASVIAYLASIIVAKYVK